MYQTPFQPKKAENVDYLKVQGEHASLPSAGFQRPTKLRF
jgi:hypothetical protein